MNSVDEDWLTNSLSGQHFLFHCEKTTEGTLGDRAVHAIKAVLQCIPFVISQIIKIFQMMIAYAFGKSQPSISTDSRQIHYPLLEKEGAEIYKLKLFDAGLPDDAVYLGANQEQITSTEGETVLLPRTLYHLLYIYLALQSNDDNLINKMLKSPISMDNKDCSESIQELELERLEQSTIFFQAEAFRFLSEKKYNSFTWKRLEELVDELCNEIQSIVDIHTEKNKTHQHNQWQDFENFFILNPKKFQDSVLQALAVEWSSPADTEILYRASHLSRDNIVREDNTSHSLSFASSIFSGIVFEGSRWGTCPMSYYTYSHDKELYALRLTPSKVNKYFFYPAAFKEYGLLPLIARGEFSHPRLKIFTESKDSKIEGVFGYQETAQELLHFDPTEKIPTLLAFQEKIHKIYTKHLCVLGQGCQ